jgi:hypothetical protein
MTKPGLVSRCVFTVSALVLLGASPVLLAQEAPPPTQPLSQDKLDALVAPIALYPDRLVGQVLVAATYPLEIVEAAQWLQRNPGLQGAELVEVARQQNWDASVQALVVFPDVINRLNSDVRWTTDLGNAFLAQQADLMNAVQDMRARARAAGKLDSGPQETVTTETQGDRTVVDIQPTDPRVVYVPTYDPQYIWGPPAAGYYPPLYYPEVGFGFGFGPGIYVGAFFGGLGWGGWGWSPNWFGCSIFENGFFFQRFGFRGFHGDGRFGGRGVWAHNPEHRLGVAYPRGAVASRFGGANAGARGQRFAGGRSPSASFGRSNPGGSLGNRGAGVAVPRFAPQTGGTSGSRTGAGQTRGSNHFGASMPRTGPAAPSYSGRGGSYGRYQPAPRYGGTYGSNPWSGGSRSYHGNQRGPIYRSAPPYGGGYRSRPAPSYGRRGPSNGGGGSAHGGGGSARGAGSSAHGGGSGGRHH